MKFTRSFIRSSATNSNSDDSSDDVSVSSQSLGQSKILDEAKEFEKVIEDEDNEVDASQRRKRRNGDSTQSRTRSGDQYQRRLIKDEADNETGRKNRVARTGSALPCCTAAATVCSLVHRDIDSLTPKQQSQPSNREYVHRVETGTEQSRDKEQGTYQSTPPVQQISMSASTNGNTTHFEEQNRTSSPVPTIPELEEPIPLTDEEKIEIIEEDFGVLAKEGEKEEILWESDGDIRRGVSILGVIHLTTHRLTLHASLTGVHRRDDISSEGIIRSSPATIHRPNPYRKRKIWLELTHDMISTFNSSLDVDRIKPIRSVLVTDIINVRIDRKSIYLEAKVSGIQYVYRETFGFDTEEATIAWYNDIQYAKFLNSRPKASDPVLPRADETAMTSDMLEEDGIRIAIPLECIESYDMNIIHLKEMCRLSIHTTGGELEDVSFSVAFSTCTEEGRQKFDQLERYAKLRRNEAKAREVTSGEQGKEKDGASIVLQLGSSLNWIMPTNTVLEGASAAGKCPVGKKDPEVVLKAVFAIPSHEQLWITRARFVQRTYSLCQFFWGYLGLTSKYICFLAKVKYIDHVKYRLPLSQFKGSHPVYTLRGYGLSFDFEGHPSLTFTFNTAKEREEAMERLNEAAKNYALKTSTPPGSPPPIQMSDLNPSSSHEQSSLDSTTSSVTPSLTRSSSVSSATISPPPPYPKRHHAHTLPKSHRSLSSINRSASIAPVSRALSFFQKKSTPIPPEYFSFLPHVINLPEGTRFKVASRHFVCLTIGSRGDIQPYIALGKGLLADGHRVTIVTHAEYKTWIESFGIQHRTAGGDPGALMKLSVENKMFSPAFFRASLGNFREWLDDLLRDSWKHCQDADILIESPSAMAGVHIAEALDIPYFRAFTMPWTKTTEFPHAFISPPADSPGFNSGSYILFDNVFWVATRGQVNRWRRDVLHLGNTDMSHLAQSQIPFIYNFSTAVVPKPLDWRDEVTISGYWFLDNPDKTWQPAPKLLSFMQKARDDGKPLVYIGFGSITVPNPQKLTKSIVKGVLRSGVRAIISKGWSSRMKEDTGDLFEYPPECYVVDSIPHDWLFPLIDAALHHGGAGTTGASLRAGIPTLIKPWFGDQFFWASRVQKLGAGIRLSTVKSASLSEALKTATSDRIMKEKAAAVGQRIRSEDGVQNAIQAIYTYLNRAKRTKPIVI